MQKLVGVLTIWSSRHIGLWLYVTWRRGIITPTCRDGKCVTTTSKRTFIPGAPHLIKMQIYVHLMYLSIFVKYCALEPIGCLTISSWWSNGRDKVPVTYSNVWCILVDNTCNVLWQAVTLPNWSCSLTSMKMESPMRPPVTQIQMMKVLASMKTIFYDPLPPLPTSTCPILIY